MKKILAIAQLVISLFLIILVLLQKGGSAGQLFGGGGENKFYRTMRGAEKKIFWATVVLGFLFIGLGVLNLTL